MKPEANRPADARMVSGGQAVSLGGRTLRVYFANIAQPAGVRDTSIKDAVPCALTVCLYRPNE